jgi:Tol biopolymer transport system component
MRGLKLSLLGAAAVGLSVLTGCLPGAVGRQQVVITDPMVSPDGKKVVFVSTQDGNPEIYLMNVDGTGMQKLTNDSAVDAAPSWFPDGKKIIFTSDRTGKFELYTMNADGSNQQPLKTTSPSSPSSQGQ